MHAHRLHWLACALALSVPVAHATEGGGSSYPSGVENFMVGAVPPPGWYGLLYGNVTTADRLKDNRGDALPVPGFGLRANVVAPRLIWSTPYQWLGGNLVFHAIFPVVDLTVEAAGARQRKTGLGDITLGVFGLAHHHSPQLHSVVGLDIVLPTGRYQRGDLANIGRNHLAVQPLFAMSRIDPDGFNGDFKLTLNFNQKNKDTNYRSGHELFVDYSAGWGLGQGWVVGVGGHLRTQFTDDRAAGATVPGNRARAFSIGPSLKYDNGRGWIVTAKLQADTGVRNTVEGRAFWIKTSLPF